MKNILIKKYFILLGLLGLFLTNSAFGSAEDINNQINLLRSQLACQKDKQNQDYIKLKNKLNKLIIQNKIDYSLENRYNDAIKLIQERKFNPAIYELKALIEENYNVTKCYEFLGDICLKSEGNYSKAVKYYKLALKENRNNISSAYKLAKIYLKSNKNILGIEYLKYTIENTQSPEVLAEIEYMLKNKINPDDKYDANNLYEALGLLYVRLNKKQEAFSAFNTAIKLNPNDLYLKYYLGDLYYSIGDAKSASLVYDSILYENPADSGIRTSKAKALYYDGDLLSADKEYRQMLENNPDSVQALYGLYKIYERKLPPDKILEKIYSNVPNYKPTKAEAVRFAKVMENTGDTNAVNNFISYAKELDRIEKEKIIAEKRAQEEKRKALEEQKLKQKQLEEQKRNKINLEAEKIRLQKEELARKKAEAEAQRLKKIAEQKAALEKAKKEKLEKERIALEQAKKLQLEKQKKEEERKLLLKKQQEEKRLEQQRLLAEKKAKEAQLLAEKKAKEEELRLQKQAEIRRQKELEKKKAQELAIKKQREIALLKEEKEKQEKLLAEQKQKDYEDRLIAIEAQKAKEKDLTAYNNAMEQIKKYSAESPKSAQNYIAIANTYRMNNQTMSAIRNYKEAMKLDPVNSDIYYNLGLSYMELNSFVTARANLVKAVNLDKGNSKAINLLAFVDQKVVTSIINNAFSKFEKKEYIEAYDILNEGIKDFGGNSQLYYYRALVADAMGRNSAQIMDLQKSIELDATNYMSFYQLGKAYEKVNDERNALVAYERFLSTEPDEKELVDEIQKKVIKLGEKYY